MNKDDSIEPKMNSNTHKVITAIYHPVKHHFAVLKDWDLKDVEVRDRTLYNKNEKQDVPEE